MYKSAFTLIRSALQSEQLNVVLLKGLTVAGLEPVTSLLIQYFKLVLKLN